MSMFSKKNYRVGFIFYFLLTLVLSFQFFSFMLGSNTMMYMDASGWGFYVMSCISHAASIALLPLLLFMLLMFCRLRYVAGAMYVIGATFLSTIAYIDMLVYNIYRFHINGIMLNMFFGKGGGEIFNFSTSLYIQMGMIILGILIAYSSAWFLINRYSLLFRIKLKYLTIGLVFATLYAHGYHIYADFNNQVSVQKCRRLLPYYFPTSAGDLLMDLGFVPSVQSQELNLENGKSEINYPLQDIQTEEVDNSKNIVLILIDSWNPRAFTAECMPNIYEYASSNQWYKNHWGCSNGTRSSVFGLFFGISSYYWDFFESNHVSPVFIEQLLAKNYQCNVYPSAQIYDPPFGRVIFNKLDNVRVETEGKTSLERDIKITNDFISSLDTLANADKPFFSFLFYDLPHSFELPKEKLYKFQPSWEYADYSKLNNDIDATPFWNLYRNTCYQVDSIVGNVLAALEEKNLQDNTVVIITGDHSQEFNENKKNYWGHNGNFSHYQIGVPLVCHFPDKQSAEFTHRTTHYDIVPTLMKNYLGVLNDVGDFSMGYLLEDTANRYWHIVGSELNYAFITDKGDIIEKKAEGTLEITDSILNPLLDYEIDVVKMKESLDKLNVFLK